MEIKPKKRTFPIQREELTEELMLEIEEKEMTPDEVYEKYGICWEEYELFVKEYQEM